MQRRLFRSEVNKKLGGVCGGIGEYFNIDPTMIRLGWAVLSLLWGIGILAYIVAWIVIPPST